MIHIGVHCLERQQEAAITGAQQPHAQKLPCMRAGESGTSGSRRRASYATPGRLGAPGEKQRLKRAKVDAKRAVRAAGRGFDAAAAAAELERFVLSEGDMKVSCLFLCHW